LDTPFLNRPNPVKWLLLALVPLAVCYGLLINPYWVPGGDSEVYTAIARSFVRGEGFLFNGQPVAISPPGWPWVLSLLMRVSPEFWFLKICTSGMMLASLGVSFFVLRRFVSDPAAAVIILVAGVLHPLYPMTFWMHTEALFCLLSALMLLLAARIVEGRDGPWSIGFLLVLLAASCFVRWTGLIQVVLVVGILLSRPSDAGGKGWLATMSRRRLVIALIALLVTFGWFRAPRYLTALSEEQATEARDAGGGAEVVDPGTEAAAPGMLSGSNTDRPMPLEYGIRLLTAGRWFGWFLWYPSRFGSAVTGIDSLALCMGWLTIGLLAVTLVATVRKLNFFYLSLALYTGALVMNWPNVNARYFVPVAPFILAGVWQAISLIRSSRSDIHLIGVLVPLSATAVLIDVGWIPVRALLNAANLGVISNEMRPLRLLTFAVIVFWAGYFIVRLARARLKLGIEPIQVVGTMFFGSILAANLPLLAIDIRVMRSGDAFYRQWEASSVEDLIAAGKWLHDTKDQRAGKVGISEAYWNLGKSGNSKFGLRAAHLLSDCVVRPARRKDMRLGRVTDNPRLNSWARNVEVDYFLFQEPWLPWRLWHFRLPESLQQFTRNPMKGATTQPDLPKVDLPRSGGWRLFVRRSATLEPAEIPELTRPWPRRVPGL